MHCSFMFLMCAHVWVNSKILPLLTVKLTNTFGVFKEDEYLAAVMCAVTSTGEGGVLRGRKSGLHKAIKSKTSWLPKLQLPKGSMLLLMIF